MLKQWHTQILKPLTPNVDCFFQMPWQKAYLYITCSRDRKMQVNLLQWICRIKFYMEGNQKGKRRERKTLTRYGDKSAEHLFCATTAFISIAQLNSQKKKVIYRKNIEIITPSKAWEPALYLSVFNLQYTTCIFKLNRFKFKSALWPWDSISDTKWNTDIFFPPTDI